MAVILHLQKILKTTLVGIFFMSNGSVSLKHTVKLTKVSDLLNLCILDLMQVFYKFQKFYFLNGILETNLRRNHKISFGNEEMIP